MATARGRTITTWGAFLMPVGLSGAQPGAPGQVIISDAEATKLALTDEEATKLTIQDEPGA